MKCHSFVIKLLLISRTVIVIPTYKFDELFIIFSSKLYKTRLFKHCIIHMHILQSDSNTHSNVVRNVLKYQFFLWFVTKKRKDKFELHIRNRFPWSYGYEKHWENKIFCLKLKHIFPLNLINYLMRPVLLLLIFPKKIKLIFCF